MSYRRGDIVLTEYEYSDGTGSKRRPAYVISTDHYNENRRRVVLGMITSRIDVHFTGDWILKDWEAAGLNYPSRATSVLRTVSLSFVERKLGRLSQDDLRSLERELKQVLGF